MSRWARISPYPELGVEEREAIRVVAQAQHAGQPLNAEQLRAALPVRYPVEERLQHRLQLVESRDNQAQLTLLGALHDPESAAVLDALDKVVRWAHRAYSPARPRFLRSEVAAAAGVDVAALEHLARYATDLGIHLSVAKDSTRGGEARVEVSEMVRRTSTLEEAIHERYRHLIEAENANEREPDPDRFRVTLRAVRVERFRALSSLALTLPSQLTVLVGANGAGKSTVLDAIVFVGRAARFGLKQVLGRDESLAGIVTAGESGGPAFRFDFDLDLGGNAPTHGELAFELASAGRTTVVEHEWLRTRYEGDERTWIEARRAVAHFADERGGLDRTPTYKRAGELALVHAPMHRELAAGVRAGLASFELLDRDPARSSRGVRAMEEILAQVAGSDVNVKQLHEVVQTFLPDVVGIERHVVTGDPPELRIVERNVARPLEVYELSAGARQLLLIACLYVVDPRPRTILLEEPDAGLHVGKLHALRDLLREVARDSVVIATSHSPTFVALLDPDREVIALDREERIVHARPYSDVRRSKRWLDAFGDASEAFVRSGLER
jgi:predicted ATPase